MYNRLTLIMQFVCVKFMSRLCHIWSFFVQTKRIFIIFSKASAFEKIMNVSASTTECPKGHEVRGDAQHRSARKTLLQNHNVSASTTECPKGHEVRGDAQHRSARKNLLQNHNVSASTKKKKAETLSNLCRNNLIFCFISYRPKNFSTSACIFSVSHTVS